MITKVKKPRNDTTLKKLEAISGETLTLGSLLWAIRQGETLSQIEFAEMLGISKQYLCDVERGRRFVSPKMAAQYAKKLGYSVNQFVRLCLQDMINRDGIRLKVEVKAAA
jgi:transcriptional regulator with XRE-family HTH domain